MRPIPRKGGRSNFKNLALISESHICAAGLATAPKKLQALGKPALLAILTKDVETLQLAFQMRPFAIGNGIIVAVCLVYMATLSWQLFFVFASVLAVCLVGYQPAEQRPLRQLVQVRE